jgi:glycosyltransferase involved in cell wall biosynthesis
VDTLSTPDVSFARPPRTNAKGKLGIDRVLSFSYPRREIAVVGWCCFDDCSPVQQAWLVSDEARVPCLTGLARPDVAHHHNARALAHAGFLCRLPVRGSMTAARLVAQHDDVEQTLGEVRVRWQESINEPESSPRQDYVRWLRIFESRLFWPVPEVEQRLRMLSWTPLVSVILPTFNTPQYYLHRCIDSVVAQHYPHWELCITDDGSSGAAIREYLMEWAARDPRICVSFSEQRGGISAASNRSIEQSSGDFIVLLDHDDELHPFALLEVARCLNAHPETDLVYSDEDKIDQIGTRSFPAFKPDFDADLFCGFDYLGHLVAIRASLVRQLGGFRSAADGAQDWDLLLRVTSATQPKRIKHIAKPLYHWRMHDGSTAFSLSAKPYTMRAWDIALQRHVESADSYAVREGLFVGSMRVLRRPPSDSRVSVLYRASDGPHQHRALKRSNAPRRTAFFELILSAVHPADDSVARPLMTVEDLRSDVTIVVNCGIDCVNHGFVDELTAQALREECGVVGGTILDPDGVVVTAGLMCLGDGTYVNPFEGLAQQELGYMGQARVVRAVASIASHVFAFRTSRLLDLNGLACVTEDSLDDVCARLVRSAHASGLKVLHTPYAIATLRTNVKTYCPPQGAIAPRHLIVNPNLENFSNVSAVLKDGII